MAVADANDSLLIGGSGDVIEPTDGIIGLGSGGVPATGRRRSTTLFHRVSDPEHVARRAAHRLEPQFGCGLARLAGFDVEERRLTDAAIGNRGEQQTELVDQALIEE